MRGFFRRTGGLSRELEISRSPSSFTAETQRRIRARPAALPSPRPLARRGRVNAAPDGGGPGPLQRVGAAAGPLRAGTSGPPDPGGLTPPGGLTRSREHSTRFLYPALRGGIHGATGCSRRAKGPRGCSGGPRGCASRVRGCAPHPPPRSPAARQGREGRKLSAGVWGDKPAWRD